MYAARVRRLFVPLRLVLGCGVSYAASCLLRTNVRASVCVTIMVRSVAHRILTAPGLNFVQKMSSFTPRHERPRYDPSSGGGRLPFPTNPTSTTFHLVRRLASSSKLLKSSSRYLPRFASMADASRLQITANDQVRRISPGIPFS